MLPSIRNKLRVVKTTLRSSIGVLETNVKNSLAVFLARLRSAIARERDQATSLVMKALTLESGITNRKVYSKPRALNA